ncbi:MAG: trigger factor [Candidatus Eutrophobiaceae bacterium]
MKQIGDLGRELHIIVPAPDFSREFQQRINELVRTVNVRGFRPGKVPLDIIKNRYGESAREEISQRIVERELQNALKESDLKILDRPQLIDMNNELGGDFSFSVSFEIFPEVKLDELEKNHVERLEVKIAEADMERMAEDLRRQYRKLELVERAAAIGDVVNVDFETRLGGELVAQGDAQAVDVELGADRFISGFEQQLEGLASGKEKDFALTMPEEYPKEELRGKQLDFHVRVNKVLKPSLPEMDEEFYGLCGVLDKTRESFDRSLKSSMERESDAKIREHLRKQVHDILVDKYLPESLPSALIKQRMDVMRSEKDAGKESSQESRVSPASSESSERSMENGLSETENETDKLLRQKAHRAVGLEMIYQYIVDTEKMRPDPARVRQHIEDVAASYQDSEAMLNHLYANAQFLGRIERLSVEQQVEDWLVERMTSEAKKCTFGELRGLMDETG